MTRLRLVNLSVGVIAVLATSACASGGDVVPGHAGSAQPTSALYRKPGQIKMFPDTFGDAVPDGIVAGPDGQIWFTDIGNDAVGRINSRGKYTMETPAGAELSDGITVGPDGNLWFTLEQQYGGIGQITPKGVVTLFRDPGGSYPQGITAGPDGALWFAESAANAIGRITVTGSYSAFPTSYEYASPAGIATGPTETFGLRVSVQGNYPELAGIARGPGGFLWFTSYLGAAVGRITTF